MVYYFDELVNLRRIDDTFKPYIEWRIYMRTSTAATELMAQMRANEGKTLARENYMVSCAGRTIKIYSPRVLDQKDGSCRSVFINWLYDYVRFYTKNDIIE